MSSKRSKKDTTKNNKKAPRNKEILKLKPGNGAEKLHTQRLPNTLKLMTLMLMK